MCVYVSIILGCSIFISGLQDKVLGGNLPDKHFDVLNYTNYWFMVAGVCVWVLYVYVYMYIYLCIIARVCVCV